MLAEAWWKKSGKRLRMLPVFANRKERTFTFGDEIVYQPENGFASEQERILKEAYNQLLFLSGTTITGGTYSAGDAFGGWLWKA